MFKRVAALYDIHGNLPALEAVLGDVQVEDVDLIVVGGDVLPGPMVAETIDRLLALDIPTRFILGNGDVLFVHATPQNDTDIFTQLTAEARLRPIFDPLHVPMVVCGHTHMQFDRSVGAVRVINAGSVGMPFDEPGAYWLLLGPDVEFRHTRYDLQTAADRVRATSYPQAEDFASRNIMRPPSKADTLTAFAAYELK